MTALLSLWRVVRGLPVAVHGTVGVVALAGLLWAWHGHSVRAAYDDGRADVLASASFDSTLVMLADAARDRAVARVDTVRDTVRVRVERVVRVTERVPDSVRVAFPVVDTLIVESRALAGSLDSLSRALDTERAAATMALEVSRAAVISARLVTIAQADTITALKKRPRWRTVAGGALVGALGGVLAMGAR